MTLPLYASFPARRVLFQDDDVIVIDKPWGLSTHAPDEGRHDDVVSWLKADDPKRYLGIHQRLDRDTSGVLLFARRKEANPGLAKQFEGHLVKKSYLAVIEGKVADETVLEHFLREGKDGLREARPKRGRPDRGEQLAITHVRTLERRGKRCLVALTPETGRTHQLRVQLAAIGAPIVGDVDYGGAPDMRVMLHAQRLELRHPISDAPLSFEAPTPHELSLALEGRARGALDLAQAVESALERRFGILDEGTTALRLINAEGDGIAGVTVDLYGRHAVVSYYEEIAEDAQKALYEALIAQGVAGVYAKFRPKHASRIVDSRRDDFAPKTPVLGEAAPEAFTILENGIPFEVRLGDGLSTGLFLDQRDNRRRVRDLAKGKSLLNLFAYTGGFSVAAAVGGAISSTTVDTSAGALVWAAQNLARVGADATKHVTVESDVFPFLQRTASKQQRWDLVVLDPPSFSTTKSTTFSAESDYTELAAAALHVVAPGGVLLACTNHRSIAIAKLRRVVHEGARRANVTIKQMKNLTTPNDFPAVPGRESHLKTLLVTVA